MGDFDFPCDSFILAHVFRVETNSSHCSLDIINGVLMLCVISVSIIILVLLRCAAATSFPSLRRNRQESVAGVNIDGAGNTRRKEQFTRNVEDDSHSIDESDSFNVEDQSVSSNPLIWTLSASTSLLFLCQVSESVLVVLTKPSYSTNQSILNIQNYSSISNDTSGHFIKGHSVESNSSTLLLPFISSFANFIAIIFSQIAPSLSRSKRQGFFLLIVETSVLLFIFFFSCYRVILSWIHIKLNFQHVKMLTNLFICIFSFFMIASVRWKNKRKNKLLNGVEEVRKLRYMHYHCSIMSRLTFYWFLPILKMGRNGPLEPESLGQLPHSETTVYQFQRFNEHFLQEKSEKGIEGLSLWHCMFQMLRLSLILGGGFRLLADCTGFITPLGIKYVVQYIEEYPSANTSTRLNYAENLTISQWMSNGYVMAVIMLFGGIIQSTFSQCSTFLVNSEGIHVRLSLQALIYKKLLKLSPTKSGDSSGTMDDVEKSSMSTDSSGKSCDFDCGSICNLISADTNNVMMFFWMMHFTWAIPLKLVILMFLLYRQLGVSALLGSGICVAIMIPLQILIAKSMSANSKELMEHCDDRLKSITEVIEGMKLLKLHGLEFIFRDQIKSRRARELKNLDRDLLFRSIITFLTQISTVIVTLITFGLYPLLEQESLKPSSVFSGLALFNQLTVPLFILPITVPVIIDAMVSVERIKSFLVLKEVAKLGGNHDNSDVEENSQGNLFSGSLLESCRNLKLQKGERDYGFEVKVSKDPAFLLEDIKEDDEEDICSQSIENSEIKKAEHTKPNETKEDSKEFVSVAIEFKNGYFSWSSAEAEKTSSDCSHEKEFIPASFNLHEINLKILKNTLNVVVGATGSGKTSLVSAILGELRSEKGEIDWHIEFPVAYAAQKPWILDDTIRENILFGNEMSIRRYRKVIEACALQPDLDILPDKDLTEIGSNGINMSGGQRQRIAVARALYSTCSLVILDDPLSALDVDVAYHVFNKGIRTFLLQNNRTVVLVTHHLPALRFANQIIAMEDGSIRALGSLHQIKLTNPVLYNEWKAIISKKEAELKNLMERKTAKERWSLLKLVSRIGLQFKARRDSFLEKENDQDEESHITQILKRKRTFFRYNHLSHDIFLPSDECSDDLMAPILRRRTVSRASRESTSPSSSQKHEKLMRLTSLQPHGTENRGNQKNLSRLRSLPTSEEKCKTPIEKKYQIRFDSQAPCNTILNRIFSSRKNRSSGALSSIDIEMKSSSCGSSVEGSTGDNEAEVSPEESEHLVASKEDVVFFDKGHGRVPWSVYWLYISACGTRISIFYVMLAILYEFARICNNLWLSKWSDSISKLGGADNEKYDDIMRRYYTGYVFTSLIVVAFSFAGNMVGKIGGAKSRKILHDKMLECIVKCPVHFFDSTPIGRVLNRFSSDTAIIDRKICISLQRFLQFILLCLSAIVVNTIVNVWFLLVSIPVVAVYYYIQRTYRFTSRELQRIQAVSKSPVYSHCQETFEGLSTIRAFGQEARFFSKMLSKLDANNIADMFINVGNRWLSIALDHLGSCIVFLASLIALLSSQLYPKHVTASMVGLAINYTLLVPVYLNWVVKFLAEVEMFMHSVDRINEYSQLDEEDYESKNKDSKIPDDWPSTGVIKFDAATVRYGTENDPIISNFSIKIEDSEKVGICGRSGSGKSTLLMSLLRVTDVSQGTVYIDNVDIRNVPLLKLRSMVTVIPQENFLFSETLRFNLDPQNKFSDEEIWQALDLCQLKCHVQSLPALLASRVHSGGVTFSAGQKQLLALTRAVLHKSKIILMDEFTSSVDNATEHVLLNVVKNVFKTSTVLSVAHRLNTIIDSNRIIVLDHGHVIEDDSPTKLLKRKDSQFASMLRKADEQSKLNN